MRLSAKDLAANVVIMPGTVRPVRLRMAGLSYCLEPDEAIELANQLADAVAEINTTERKNTP